MDSHEINKAARKFQVRINDFIKEYLKKYPTYEAIDERARNGERMCIDYRTLEISMGNKSELTRIESCEWSRYENVLAFNMISCTTDEYGGNGRDVKYQDTDGIAYQSVETFVRYNKIDDYWSLPAYLLPSTEEIAAEQEYERKCKEEKERKRQEKERIRKEHAFRKDATSVMLIIPDIHGRTFWKQAVKEFSSLPVIFLGDYLDPYYNRIEKIKAGEALDNFMEILQWRHSHSGQVTMLFGNHDLHYFSDDVDCSRKDTEREYDIKQLFLNNIRDFQIALCVNMAGTAFLFSHAGVLPGWLDLRFPGIDKHDPVKICNVLNSSLRNDDTFTHTLVVDASCYRGGPSKFGSPVWADIDEHGENASLDGNVFQIFGHTQQEEDPIFCPHFCCLDCRRPFLLTSEGKIMEAF